MSNRIYPQRSARHHRGFCVNSTGHDIGRHLLPSFMSHLIASATLAIPNMILGETALSFLGLGIQPPAASWGGILMTGVPVRVPPM